MTAPGRYGGSPRPRPRPRPAPPADVALVRIIAPAHLEERVRQVLEVAAETMPGWRIVTVSSPQPAENGRIRRYIDLEVRDA